MDNKVEEFKKALKELLTEYNAVIIHVQPDGLNVFQISSPSSFIVEMDGVQSTLVDWATCLKGDDL